MLAQDQQNAVAEAEQALVGTILVIPEAFDRAAPHVSPADFSVPAYGVIWDEAAKLRAAGRPTTPAMLAPSLTNATPKGMHPSQMLAVCAVQAVSLVQVPDYALLVRKEALRRRMNEAVARGSYGEVPELVRAIEDCDRTGPAKVSFSVALGSSVEMARAGDLRPAGISTGFADLDRLIGGYVPTDLIILAARPGMGKSTFAISSARQCAARAEREGQAVALLSLEGSLEQVSQRILSDASWTQGRGIHYTRWRTGGTWSDEELRRLAAVEKDIRTLPLDVDGQAGMSLASITAYVRTIKRKFERMDRTLAVLLIDQLGWMDLGNRYAGQRHLELGGITRGLKELAQREGIAIVLAHQLSRGVEGRDNKRPMLSDLRESGHIEQDADIVLSLYREAYYLERSHSDDKEKDADRAARLVDCQNKLEAHILKNRHGADGVARLFADMPSCALRDASFHGYRR